MKKILQIIPSLKRNGTETYVINNYKFIDKSKFSFDFYIMYNDSNEYLEDIKKLKGNVFFSRYALKERNIFKHFKEIYYILKNHGPYDAVHSHLNLQNSWFLMAAKYSGVKTRISHGHMIVNKTKKLKGSIYQVFKKIVNNSFSNYKVACTSIVGNSLFSKKVFKKKGIVLKNGIFINEWLETKKTDLEVYVKKYNIPKNCFVIGNISRFDNNKNQDFILDVFYEIKKIIPNSILILGGPDSGILSKIIQKSKSLNIYENIRFIGERNDVRNWLKIIDVLIFPSKQEGFGLVLIESQASGIPCVVSDSIPKEADMKLDLIRFLNLSESSSFWAKEIISIKDKTKRGDKDLYGKIVENGYSIIETVKVLEKIYND